MSDPITPHDWSRLEPLLDAVLDAAPDRRAALIAELSGGDEARRSELERLVAESERDHPLLDRPAAERFAGMFSDEAVHFPESLTERYRVTRELGRGGMATVYLARDLKHGRDVAVKLVRPEIAAALGRERFLREIEIVAQLRHPHIVPLYDSGEAEDSLYYVMPYEEGHSLRERLLRDGPLPLDDALFILRDICDALGYAHQHGIVHRDVKPDNVLLSGRHALVTDFGVAKAVSEATENAGLTSAGIVLGTPAYMAPEQATADPHIDHRADIYALGAIAYELLAGRPPFAATTSQQVLAAHVTEQPEPVGKYRQDLSPALEQLVMRCLEKRPDDRWQRMEDLLVELQSVAAATSDGARPVTTAPQVPTIAPAQRRLLWVMAAVVVAVAGTVALMLPRGGAPAPTLGRQTQFTTDPGVELYPAMSPDGNVVAYAAGSSARMRIYLRPVSGGRTLALSNDTATVESQPTWSSDGERVLFLSRGGAYVASSLGGDVHEIVSPGIWPVTSATWSPDGKEIAAVRGDSLLVYSAEGTTYRFVVRGVDLHSCDWSPAGNWLACVSGNVRYVQPGAFFANQSPSRIVLIAAADGRTVPMTDSATFNQNPRWSSDGAWLMFVSNRDGPRDIYALAVRPDGRPRGSPERITIGTGVHSFSLDAGNGRLAYAVYQERANLWSLDIPDKPPVSIDAAVQLTSGSQVVEVMRASLDGKWVYYDSDLAGNSDIYRIAAGGGEPERLTSDASDERAAVVSPTGTEFAFHSFRTGSRDVFVQRADGRTDQVSATSAQECCAMWSPDGTALAIADFSAGGIFVVRRDSAGRWGPPVRRLHRGFLHAWAPATSIAVASGRTVRGTVHGERLELISPDAGDPIVLYSVSDSLNDPTVGDPHWAPGGKGIYFKSHDALGRASIWHEPVAGGRPRLLVRFDDLSRPSFRHNFTTDGRRFYFAINDRQSDIMVAEVVKK